MNGTESPFQIDISQGLTETYPGAAVGVLILENAKAQIRGSNLGTAKRELILNLKKQFPDLNSLKEHPVIQAYSRYYRRFDKSYHVLGQLRSVIFENRPIPSGFPMIEAIFAAELKNMLLTAFHDLDTITFPLNIGISTGEETYITLTGEEKCLKPADMMVSDQKGVISSVIYGPDKRTCVTPSTSNILIIVYAPVGIECDSIISHFTDIENIIRLVSPESKMAMKTVFPIS